MRLIFLGLRAVRCRPKLFLAAWLLQAVFTALSVWPAAPLFYQSLGHRPAASEAFVNGFSFDLLADWRAAYGTALRAHFNTAVSLAVLYGASLVLLESLLFPAYLAPFEDAGQGRLLRAASLSFRGLAAISLAGLLLWALLYVVYGAARFFAPHVESKIESEMASTIFEAAVGLTALVAVSALRVFLMLWKSARVATGEGVRSALGVVRSHFGGVMLLTSCTLLGGALYAGAAGGAALFMLSTRHVVLGFGLQQLVLLGAVMLRLWLLAASTVLWRAAYPTASYAL